MVKMKVRSAEEAARRWEKGMLRTPFVPCPVCGRKTRAWSKCQWCKTVWNREQLLWRNRFRGNI